MSQLSQVNQDRAAATPGGLEASATAPPIAFDHARDRQLQRRAMLSMWLAMLVMALGVPTHLVALSGADTRMHSATAWPTLLGWLAAALTSAVLWIARAQLATAWHGLRRACLSGEDLVVPGALAAYVVSLPALRPAAHSAPMYFDVAAMALAWLLTGAAQRSEVDRRYAATLEQLALFDVGWAAPPVSCTRSIRRGSRGALVAGAALVGAALAALGWQVGAGQPLPAALLTGLATLAVTCPCTLGVARSSACAAGAARAAMAGWIVATPAAFWPDERRAEPPVLHLGTAAPVIFARIARAVRRASWLNTGWAISLNLLLLPLALHGPPDPLLPAAVMLLAWLLITLTNRTIGR